MNSVPSAMAYLSFFLRILLIVCFLIPQNVRGQSPYKTNRKKEATLLGLGTLILGTSILIETNIQGLTIEEIALLNRNDVNALDRNATYNYSADAKSVTDVLLISSLLLPIIPLTDKNLSEDHGKIALMYAETILLNYGITQLTKTLSLRARPYVYNENVPLDEKTKRNAQYSFYSSHVSMVSSLSFLTAAIFNQFYPDRKFMPWVWGSAALLPLATAYFRVEAGRHFPTDVITGYASGALVALFVHRLHLAKHSGEGLSLQAGPDFMALNWKF